MAVHNIEISPLLFEPIVYNKEKFILTRRNKDFQIDDYLYLMETGKNRVYTSRVWVVKITSIRDDSFEGIKSGYCLLSIRQLNYNEVK